MKTSDAIKHYGTAAELARALGVTPQAIYQWGEQVPPRRAYEIERLTHGGLRVASLDVAPSRVPMHD